LKPFRADHAVVGADFTRARSRMSVELYEKRYAEYPVSAEIASLSLANIGDTFAVREILFPLVSEGIGRARGLELSFEQRASDARPWYAQINVAVLTVGARGA